MREIDDHAVGTGQPGEITRVLQAAFDDAIHGRTERYREWLDVVLGVSAGDSHGDVPGASVASAAGASTVAG